MSKIAALILKGNKVAAIKVLNKTLENPEIFHRQVRGSKKHLGYLGISLYLENNKFEEAKLVVEKIYPGVEQLKNVAIPQLINQVGNRTAIELLSIIYRAEGKLDVSNQLASKLETFLNNPNKQRPNYLSVFNDLKLAEIFATQQKFDDAIEYLTKAIDEGYILNWRTSILYNPIFSGLHQDPRFKALVKRLETEMPRQRAIIDGKENRMESIQ